MAAAQFDHPHRRTAHRRLADPGCGVRLVEEGDLRAGEEARLSISRAKSSGRLGSG